jgi:hypothetical protein
MEEFLLLCSLLLPWGAEKRRNREDIQFSVTKGVFFVPVASYPVLVELRRHTWVK